MGDRRASSRNSNLTGTVSHFVGPVGGSSQVVDRVDLISVEIAHCCYVKCGRRAVHCRKLGSSRVDPVLAAHVSGCNEPTSTHVDERDACDFRRDLDDNEIAIGACLSNSVAEASPDRRTRHSGSLLRLDGRRPCSFASRVFETNLGDHQVPYPHQTGDAQDEQREDQRELDRRLTAIAVGRLALVPSAASHQILPIKLGR